MISRADLLRDLLAFGRPISELARDLSELDWDSEDELAALESTHLLAVLQNYLSGKLAPESVQSWANAIEGRDDLSITSDLAEVIHELANPVITRPLSFIRAWDLIERLSRTAV
jgi:hypothetical protein